MKSILFVTMTVISISWASTELPFESQTSLSPHPIVATIRNVTQEQRNKEIVLEFYTQVFAQRNSTGLERFFAPGYIQHNPKILDGSDGFLKVIKSTFPPGTPPNTRFSIERIAAEGDLVWLHVLNNIATIPKPEFDEIIVDIYRLKDELLIEHFDVVQFVPNWSANPQPLVNALTSDFSRKCAFGRL